MQIRAFAIWDLKSGPASTFHNFSRFGWKSHAFCIGKISKITPRPKWWKFQEIFINFTNAKVALRKTMFFLRKINDFTKWFFGFQNFLEFQEIFNFFAQPRFFHTCTTFFMVLRVHFHENRTFSIFSNFFTPEWPFSKMLKNDRLRAVFGGPKWWIFMIFMTFS